MGPSTSSGSTRPATTRPTGRLGGVAISSVRADLHPGWVWGLTLTVILVGGLTLYAARSAMGAALDRWLPERQEPPEETSVEAPLVVPEPERDAPRPTEPEWAFVDIEVAIRPLPGSAESLIAEGRRELPQFAGLASSNETRALLIRNRWRMWGRIWSNRVEQIRRPMPPPGACAVHAALQPTCRALGDCLDILDRIPVAASIEDARALLDRAAGVLDELRAPPEDEPIDSSAP